jgi:hypothetical protein
VFRHPPGRGDPPVGVKSFTPYARRPRGGGLRRADAVSPGAERVRFADPVRRHGRGGPGPHGDAAVVAGSRRVGRPGRRGAAVRRGGGGDELLAIMPEVGTRREFRLCACALRRHWRADWHPLLKDLLLVAGRNADGRATDDEVTFANGLVRGAVEEAGGAERFGVRLSDCGENSAPIVFGSDGPEAAAILRDIFGNPFRPAPLDPAHRTPEVISLALAAYAQRALPTGQLNPAALSVLADALEDLGAGGEVIAHLRSPGPHVRGCWAVDTAAGRYWADTPTPPF